MRNSRNTAVHSLSKAAVSLFPTGHFPISSSGSIERGVAAFSWNVSVLYLYTVVRTYA